MLNPSHPILIPLDAFPKGTHPGRYLDRYLVRRRLKHGPAADLLGMSRSNLIEILQGRRSITATTAHKLDDKLGTPEGYWLELQKRHNLEREKRRRGDT